MIDGIIRGIAGHAVLDDLPLLRARGTDHLLLVPASIHEIKVDLVLRVPASALRSTLPATGERVVHAANDIVHIGRRVRTRLSVEPR